MAKRKVERRYEATDPKPKTLPVNFQRPPTLAEQIARHMAASERYNLMQGHETAEEAEDFGTDEEDEHLYSPHELVHDTLLNRELPRYEYEVLQRQRAAFDATLNRKMRDDRAAAAARKVAEEAAQAALDASRKKSKKKPSPDGDEE